METEDTSTTTELILDITASINEAKRNNPIVIRTEKGTNAIILATFPKNQWGHENNKCHILLLPKVIIEPGVGSFSNVVIAVGIYNHNIWGRVISRQELESLLTLETSRPFNDKLQSIFNEEITIHEGELLNKSVKASSRNIANWRPG
ncbi:hypothetical protein ACFLY9_01045 [Patescibacteria group bacterium]